MNVGPPFLSLKSMSQLLLSFSKEAFQSLDVARKWLIGVHLVKFDSGQMCIAVLITCTCISQKLQTTVKMKATKHEYYPQPRKKEVKLKAHVP